MPLTADPELAALRAAEREARAKMNLFPHMDKKLLEEPDIDGALDYVRGVAKWQIENIMSMKEKADKGMKPAETPDAANARARDARTLNELVRTLERLDALDQKRKDSGRTRKDKARREADLKASLVRRLAPRFGDGIRLGYDVEAMDALAPEREAVWARLNTANFLTVNEKRAAAGCGAMEGGDDIGSGL